MHDGGQATHVKRDFDQTLTSDAVEAFWVRGYTVVREAVPRGLALALADAMREKFFGGTAHMLNGTISAPTGLVHLFHHPLQWEIRQSTRIYGAFAQLWNDPHLWVSIDRGKVVTSLSQGGALQSGFIHWDIDTRSPPQPIPLQGLVALSDASDREGGFQCVPGFHNHFHEWVKGEPADRDPFIPRLEMFPKITVPACAGDLIIWNGLLPHGNGVNESPNPRVAQLVRMYPCRGFDEEVRQRRLRMWRDQLPKEDTVEGHQLWPTFELSALGERVLGRGLW